MIELIFFFTGNSKPVKIIPPIRVYGDVKGDKKLLAARFRTDENFISTILLADKAKLYGVKIKPERTHRISSGIFEFYAKVTLTDLERMFDSIDGLSYDGRLEIGN